MIATISTPYCLIICSPGLIKFDKVGKHMQLFKIAAHTQSGLKETIQRGMPNITQRSKDQKNLIKICGTPTKRCHNNWCTAGKIKIVDK
jgi:hypothetical protein